ncbi:hypothetical protein PG993_008460 [Apiospora rasikravindrae]|uniref:Uncharacterized protein n=1 Tax=Apiospora rasikravindrae TaxID=990691 RepID=A0ABR1T0F1_9PEZI
MDAFFPPSALSRSDHDADAKAFEDVMKVGIVSGLVPTTFLLYPAGADPRLPTRETRHDDCVRLSFPKSTQAGRGLDPARVAEAVQRSARDLLLRDLGWRGVRGHDDDDDDQGGRGACRLLGVYLVREQETPARTDLERFRNGGDPERENSRLADWVEWGIMVQDRTRFRFEVLVEVKTGAGGSMPVMLRQCMNGEVS